MPRRTSSLRWVSDDAVLNRFDEGRTGAQDTKLILYGFATREWTIGRRRAQALN
jgi:hypothetical protein